MRTYEEQISAVEKRIAAHTAKKRKAMKIGFSCMSVLLVITASVTAVMVSNRNIMNKSDAGGEKLAVMESVMDSAANIEETGDVTEFETITATKFYGNITESERSKDDIFEILGEKNEKISAYEDTNYIYFFYPDGRLHRMQNIAEIHHTVKLVTDDEGIKEYSEKHLKRYIPYFDAKNYKVTVNHLPDAFPAWHLSYTIAENGIIINEINIRFLDNGELYYLVEFGIISFQSHLLLDEVNFAALNSGDLKDRFLHLHGAVSAIKIFQFKCLLHMYISF